MYVGQVWKCDYCQKEELLRAGLGHSWCEHHALAFCSNRCLRQWLDKWDDHGSLKPGKKRDGPDEPDDPSPTFTQPTP
jgi:hypothetical protein